MNSLVYSVELYRLFYLGKKKILIDLLYLFIIAGIYLIAMDNYDSNTYLFMYDITMDKYFEVALVFIYYLNIILIGFLYLSENKEEGETLNKMIIPFLGRTGLSVSKFFSLLKILFPISIIEASLVIIMPYIIFKLVFFDTTIFLLYPLVLLFTIIVIFFTIIISNFIKSFIVSFVPILILIIYNSLKNMKIISFSLYPSYTQHVLNNTELLIRYIYVLLALLVVEVVGFFIRE